MFVAAGPKSPAARHKPDPVEQRCEIIGNGRIVFDKSHDGCAKTGIAVIGALSPFGDWLVRRYLAEFGVDHSSESILFRMCGGKPCGESRLGSDYTAVHDAAFPGDKRQFRDMRRSGVMEACAGDARDVSEKFGDSIDRSSSLFKTCRPVDLDEVRQTYAARLEGRRRPNES
jgi:hypothetical protein